MAKINLDINNYNTDFDEMGTMGKDGSRNFVINSLKLPIDVNQALDLYKHRKDNPALIKRTKNYMQNITRKEKLREKLKKKLENKKNKS